MLDHSDLLGDDVELLADLHANLNGPVSFFVCRAGKGSPSMER
ncbi:hypothetical protein CBM2605_U80002 [Cupriavidus neocaledonicus]|uniref:Uncharacterized protein n=1 Tax=Cupriavidus neocaledonicus TaxID=1040979 RepID=A0ABY1VDT5_9BURK|nr:hypothetical protein CBM2605_U80002 [Cupriavidus neocaledonicus]